MIEHTRGPWDFWCGYNPHDNIEAQVTAEGGDIVVASYNHLIKEGEANAKLIAKSPEMHAALTKIAFRCLAFIGDDRPMQVASIQAILELCDKALDQ
jgi:hypothetical protein